MLALLVVADPDQALPTDLALAALKSSGRELSRSVLHSVLPVLEPVVSVVQPGTEEEAFGASHPGLGPAVRELLLAGEDAGLPARLDVALADLLSADAEQLPEGWAGYVRAARSTHLVPAGRFTEGRAASWAHRDRTAGEPRRGPM